MSQTTVEILNKAADHIERVGLHKFTYFKGMAEGRGLPEDWRTQFADAPCCMLGAFLMVTEENRGHYDAQVAFSNRVGDLVQDWNDKKSRRKGQVVAKLRKVAKELEESND